MWEICVFKEGGQFFSWRNLGDSRRWGACPGALGVPCASAAWVAGRYAPLAEPWCRTIQRPEARPVLGTARVSCPILPLASLIENAVAGS